MPPADAINSDPFLAEYTLPRPRFDERESDDLILEPLWHALRSREYHRAQAYGWFALHDAPEATPAETRAAILSGVSYAELRLQDPDTAFRIANESLDCLPGQWLANRVLLESLTVQKKFAAAIEHARGCLDMHAPAHWDEPLAKKDVLLAMASWYWKLRDWSGAKEILLTAYPVGMATLPVELLEDYFRLAMYRNDADDAAAAAALLIQKRSVESADAVLQMLVQQGWTHLALPLYRSAFTEAPQSMVLRRRLVALCLKEGNIDEARSLAGPAPLPVDIPAREKRSMRLN